MKTMNGDVNDQGPHSMNISMVIMMFCCLALIAVFFFLQPGASGWGIFLFPLLLACPLMHLFMHRGHGGHK